MAAIPAPAPKTTDITPALGALVAALQQQAASLSERIDTAAGDVESGNPLAAIGALACAEQLLRDVDALLTGALVLGRISRR